MHTTIDRKITNHAKKKETMKPLNFDENDDNEERNLYKISFEKTQGVYI